MIYHIYYFIINLKFTIFININILLINFYKLIGKCFIYIILVLYLILKFDFLKNY